MPFSIVKRCASSVPEFPTYFPDVVRRAALNGIVINEQTLHDLWAKTHEHDHTSSRPRWLADCKARLGKCIMFGIPLSRPHNNHPGLVDKDPSENFAPHACLKLLGVKLGPQWKTLISARRGVTHHKNISRRVDWGDLDSMGHVNNVTHIRWAESARIEWARRFALTLSDRQHSKQWNELWTPKGQGLILKSIKMDYKLPLTYPDTITTIHKLRALPKPTDTSFMLDVMILSNRHQRIAARGEEEIVMYDYKQMGKTKIPPFMMEAFTNAWAEQEENQSSVAREIFNVELRLMYLEKFTWDREGAVEDLGVSNIEA